ncbi:hypothetical protein AB6A40_002100 [Gnathostoma spinigerum]|uniref:Uncharacterized protein n=1 Tax=Gnathostoma spinigerum TaxID=75299 RepID=A0ABD6E884_9BILA
MKSSLEAGFENWLLFADMKGNMDQMNPKQYGGTSLVSDPLERVKSFEIKRFGTTRSWIPFGLSFCVHLRANIFEIRVFEAQILDSFMWQAFGLYCDN